MCALVCVCTGMLLDVCNLKMNVSPMYERRNVLGLERLDEEAAEMGVPVWRGRGQA